MSKITPKPIHTSSPSGSGIEGILNKIPKGDGVLLYDKTNYLLMLAGILFIIVGFILMSGGSNPDPNIFDANEVYSTRRITVAPILIIIGFIIEIFAVLKKPSERVG